MAKMCKTCGKKIARRTYCSKKCYGLDKRGTSKFDEHVDDIIDSYVKKKESLQTIVDRFDISTRTLYRILDDNNVVTRSNKFKEGGFDFIKHNYPKIFEGVGSNKVRKATDKKKQVSIRTEKYTELKELWEKLNEKVILEYKFEKEDKFKSLFVNFLNEQNSNFTVEGIKERTAQIEITDNIAGVKEEQEIYGNEITPISTMKYSSFLKELAKTTNINIKTLNSSFQYRPKQIIICDNTVV